MRENKLKAALRRREPVFGFWLSMGDPALVEIMSLVGFDYAVIDMEHAPWNFETVMHMVRAADAVGITLLVRIPQGSRENILRCLETGVGGIIVPHVESEREALDIVKAAKYALQGHRGFADATRAGGYSTHPVAEYTAKANTETLVGIQIEDKKALQDLRKIFSVKGIDLAFIGPYDLAQSMGFPTEPDHPKVVAAMEEIISVGREYEDITTGIFIATPSEAEKWLNLGAKFMACASDTLIFLEGCKSILKELRSISQEVKSK